MKKIFTSILLIIVLSSCSHIQRHDDAVRIKADHEAEYIKYPDESSFRDGKTLRGTVLRTIYLAVPNDCPIEDTTQWTFNKYIEFLDENMPAEEENFERIPIDHIELVSDIADLPENEQGNTNQFENYNDPNFFSGIRTVKQDTIRLDTCCPCACRPIDWNLDLNVSLECPKRVLPWYFIELRGSYAAFSDFKSLYSQFGSDAWQAELATGFRFGDKNQWGLGLMASYGLKLHNSFKEENVARPMIMLHGRYESTKSSWLGLCMRPYSYANFGMSIDKMSLRLFDFNFNTSCEGCKRYIEANPEFPEIDISLPISFGFGVGLNFPVNEDLDISWDIGYRSLGFGEEAPVAGFSNVPSLRRVNMFLMRIGITI